jgi:hypothetical protein
MNCPRCGAGGTSVQMKSPDYGRGAEFACYRCDPYGARFVSNSDEARRASDASRKPPPSGSEDT